MCYMAVEVTGVVVKLIKLNAAHRVKQLIMQSSMNIYTYIFILLLHLIV
jgi:hypothetical protein